MPACRDRKLPVLVQIACTLACTDNSAVQPPKVQLSNVLLPTQLQWVLVQIARIFACTDNFVACNPKVMFFCALLPPHAELHIPPQNVVQKSCSSAVYCHIPPHAVTINHSNHEVVIKLSKA